MKSIVPFELIEKPVSVGAEFPDPNKRFNCPVGAAVLFPTGSACQRNSWGWARPVLLLNADAMRSNGLELEPLEAVASFAGPRIWGMGVPGGVD